MQKQLIQTLKILLAAIVLSFGISYVYAWTGPSSAPPAGNTNPPLVSLLSTIPPDPSVVQKTGGKLMVEDGLTTLGTISAAIGNFTGDITTTSGNIGIGTDTPGAKLEVAGVSGTDGIMFPDGTLQTTAGGGAAGKWNDATGGIHYSAGNVGIGTTNPGVALDVVGSIRASDGVYIAGKKFSKIRYANLGEDSYSGSAPNWFNSPDTCNGNKTSQYSCGVSVDKSCQDVWLLNSNGVYYLRNIVCIANGYPILY